MKKKNQLAFRGGSYSLLVTAIVLAIIIVANICISALPASITKLDMSAAKLYSITSNTKVVVNNLKEDVTIYWIVQADKEDSTIETLLGKYESLSDHINVVKKNPDIFPTFSAQYTDETVANNSLVVECGDRYRYIAYNDIYVQETDVYSYNYNTSFDGEGCITSAIDYVVSDNLPQVYCLKGHGEADFPDSFSDQIKKANIELQTISLLTTDNIPDDCTALVIYAPESDISSEEREILTDYVSGGGKLFVVAGPQENTTFENLYAIIGDYGVTANEGIVVESDRNHYAFQYPYVLIPDMAENDITDSLISEGYSPIIPIATGLTVNANSSSVTKLLTTSDTAFSKIAGFGITKYEKEEGDIDGPFAVAVSIDTDNEGKIIWFSSLDFLEDMYNAYSSGANINLGMNALSSLIGERESIAIRSKSLNYNYLTISDSQGATIKTALIVIIPLAYLGIGLYVFFNTRRKQNEED